jgi:hypothetical protein
MGRQVDEPGFAGPEAAGSEVERSEVLFEVHVQPLTPGRLGVPGSTADKRRGDPLSLMLTGDLGVEEEGVITSVPCHVDKADQAAVRLAGGDPAQAVGPDLIPPSGRSPPAMCCDECHHLCIGDWPTPSILNRLVHMPDLPVSRWRGQHRYAVVPELVLAVCPAASVAPCH